MKKNKIEEFIERNEKRNKHLWENDKIEGIDYIVCPVTKTRLSMLKKNYIEKTLNISYDNFIKKYPNQKMICDKRYENIKRGLKEIDLGTGLTKHQLSMKKRSEILSKIDENGLSGFDKIGIKTRKTHLKKIDENGRNGYQRLAKYRNDFILPNGLSIQQNSLLKNLKKQENSGRISLYRKQKIYKCYMKFIRVLSQSNVNKMKKKGYEVDHIYPIQKGFDNKISPFIIADKNNLQLLNRRENKIKYTCCYISIDDLFSFVGKTKEQNDKEFDAWVNAYIKSESDYYIMIYKNMINLLGYGFHEKQ